MAARLGNVLYWLGCIVAVGWVAVSHAEEKATDDDAFLLGCAWAGDRHPIDVCGGFPTRALCEREGRAAVASGELSKFECISADKLRVIDSIDWSRIWPGITDQPTAAGPGGSDQPTFSPQIPVRTAAPDRWHGRPSAPAPVPDEYRRPYVPSPYPTGDYPPLPGGHYGMARPPFPAPTVQTVPPQAAGINPGWMGPSQGWAGLERNARPSANIEDYRRTRGKPFIAQ
jgi:hypothetical protein